MPGWKMGWVGSWRNMHCVHRRLVIRRIRIEMEGLKNA